MEKITIFYKTCLGCGIKLQKENNNLLGYINDLKNDYCFRCFQIKNYNKNTNYAINENIFFEMLKKNYSINNHYFYILDCYDFFGSRNEKIEELISKNNVTIILNKYDLLIKHINSHKLINYYENIFKDVFVKKRCNFYLVSAIKQNNIKIISNYIKKISENKIYVIGTVNTGKTSIINSLIKEQHIKCPLLTTSPYNSTTLNNINLKIDNKIIIDTPGINNSNNISNYVIQNSNSIKLFNKIKKLKTISFQLNDNQYISYENIAVFKFLVGNKTNFHFYTNEEITLHRGNINNLNNYQNNFAQQKLINLEKNISKTEKKWKLMPGSYSIFISGLGWISFVNYFSIEISINIPSSVKITIASKLI